MGTTIVYVDQTPYYYYGGTYYVTTDAPASEPVTQPVAGAQDTQAEVPEMIETDEDVNYEVVVPPVGATVPYLPEEAEKKKIKGKTYMIYEGTYYRPFASDGDTVYMVVEDPVKTKTS